MINYFTEYEKRYFFILGKTQDTFCNSALELISLDEMLFRHLKKIGYERVIFYSNNQKLFFYDDKSMELTCDPQKKSNESTTVKKDRIANTKLTAGPLGHARVTMNNTNSNESGASEGKEKKSLSLGSMEDIDVVKRVNHCMMDEKIKTVVVFTNADDFIKYFDSDAIRGMASFVDNWSRLSARNKNIGIWIFPDRRLENLKIDLERCMTWGNFFLSRMFGSKGEMSVHTVFITPPKPDEVKNIINYERLTSGLDTDFLNLEDIIKNLTKDAKAKNIGLTSVHKKICECERLDNENTDKLCGKNDKQTAFQKLDSLAGLNSFKDYINTLKKYSSNVETSISNEDKHFAMPNQDDILRIIPTHSVGSKKTNLHMLLKGRPGTGKTTVAELVGEIYYELGFLETGHTVKVTRDDLVAGYVGQTALKTRDKINEAMGGVLFIDEAYTLVEGGENDFGNEAISTLLEAMTAHNGEFAVVAAGYPDKMDEFINSNSGLNRRFSRVIGIEDYEPEVLASIFHSEAKARGYNIDKELDGIIPDFFINLFNKRDPEKWGNAGEVNNLLDKMIENSSARESLAKILYKEDVPEYLQKHLVKTLDVMNESLEKLYKLVGLNNVKEKVNTLINTMRYEKNIRGKSVPPGHYVFSGNPGTGKTTVARLLGDIFRTIGVLKRGHMVETTRADLVAEYSGQSAPKTLKKLNQAIDGVLFVDEAYNLVHSDQDQFGKEAYDTVMKFMDDNRNRICVIFAGYTKQMETFVNNNPGMESRVSSDNIVEFEDYTSEEMLEILKKMANDLELRLSNEYVNKVTDIFCNWIQIKTENFGNAREVRNLIEASKGEMCNRYAKTEGKGEVIPKEISDILLDVDIPKKYLSVMPENFGVINYDVLKEVIEKINRLIGLESVKNKIKKLTSQMKANSKKLNKKESKIQPGHYIFSGNPGTGKTTVARYMGDIFKALGILRKGHLIDATRVDFVAGYHGQSAIKTMAKLKEALDGVLFIDEAYSLVQGDSDSFGKEAFDTIMKFMEDNRERICVIFAGYTKQMGKFINNNPGMESRVSPNNIVEFEDYTPEEMTDIIKKMAEDLNVILSESYLKSVKSIFIHWNLTRTESFGNAREVRNLIEASRMEQNDRIIRLDEKGISLSDEDWTTLLEEDIPSKYRNPVKDSKKIKKDFAPISKDIVCNLSNITKDNVSLMEMLEDVEKSLLYITVEDKDGNISRGSGFIISPDGYAITCEHVIRDAEKVNARVRIKGRLGGDDTNHKCDVLHQVPGIDMALVKLEGKNFPFINILNPDESISKGESIALLSYPFGDKLNNDYTLTDGIISSSSDQKDAHGVRMMMSIEAKRGSSGGPIICKRRGKVVGILVGSVTNEEEELNYMRPIQYFWELFTK